MKKKIDFTIPGTKLPEIPSQTLFRATSWGKSNDSCISLKFKEKYSFGVKKYNNIDYILAENKDYKWDNYFMFKLSDIERLAEEQNMLWIEDDFILPDKWVIKENEIIAKWAAEKFRCSDKLSKSGWCYLHVRDNMSDYNFKNGIEKGYTEITEEEFIKYVLKQENNTNIKNQELIGYKLIKPEYKDAVLKIVKNFENFERLEDSLNNLHWVKKVVNELQEAKVLDIWFEPCYKSTEEVVNMGDFNLTFKDNKVFHKTEDITQYVKDVYNWYQINKRLIFSSYSFEIGDIHLNHTGCQRNTKISQWIEVYNKLNKL